MNSEAGTKAMRCHAETERDEETLLYMHVLEDRRKEKDTLDRRSAGRWNYCLRSDVRYLTLELASWNIEAVRAIEVSDRRWRWTILQQSMVFKPCEHSGTADEG